MVVSLGREGDICCYVSIFHFILRDHLANRIGHLRRHHTDTVFLIGLQRDTDADVLAHVVRKLRFRVPITEPRAVCVEAAHFKIGWVIEAHHALRSIVVFGSILFASKEHHTAVPGRVVDRVLVADVRVRAPVCAFLVEVLDESQNF